MMLTDANSMLCALKLFLIKKAPLHKQNLLDCDRAAVLRRVSQATSVQRVGSEVQANNGESRRFPSVVFQMGHQAKPEASVLRSCKPQRTVHFYL
jgi:hypothetical protein